VTDGTNYAGNEWFEVVGASYDDLAAIERELGIELSVELRGLLHRCAGGHPTRSYFYSEIFGNEFMLGALLRVDDSVVLYESVRSAYRALQETAAFCGYPTRDVALVPFAVDDGNSALLCLDEEGRVIHRLFDDEEGPPDAGRWLLAKDLPEFLAGLSDCPY